MAKYIQKMTIKLFVLFLTIGLVISFYARPLQSPQKSGSSLGVFDQPSVNDAIKQLWSPIDSERRNGIQRIQEIGAPAIEPLVELLSDLVHEQRPRFPTGKEEEGELALQMYLKNAGSAELAEELGRLAINQRLME